MKRPLAILLFLCFGSLGCATTGARPGAVPRLTSTGLASFVTSRYQGHATASGALYDERQLTAAHRTLPFGTRVRVTNVDNGRSVVVTIVDRGPFRAGRVIDVSKRAATDLGFVREGLAHVRLEMLPDEPRADDSSP